jgi:hypothetical protein
MVGIDPYPVTMAPYGYQWFELAEPSPAGLLDGGLAIDGQEDGSAR